MKASYMERNSNIQNLSVMVRANGEMALPNCEDIFVSPWPEIDPSPDDASNGDYEQYDAPRELLLLLDEEQTAPEVREIVLNSLARTEEVVSASEDPSGPNELSDGLRAIEIPETSESSQQVPDSRRSQSFYSLSTSTHSLSTSTSPDSNNSEDVTGYGPKKVKLSTLLSSATHLFGSVKQAITESSSADKVTLPRSPHSTNSS